jgi:hypothetical protein
MHTQQLLDAVRTENVQFATMRRPGSPFAILDRKVLLVAPPELEQLAALGDPELLDELVELLRDPTRAYAAAVVLAAVTGRETKEVETYSTRPEAWWDVLGRDAHARWRAWLDDARGGLRWDAAAGEFVEPPA